MKKQNIDPAKLAYQDGQIKITVEGKDYILSPNTPHKYLKEVIENLVPELYDDAQIVYIRDKEDSNLLDKKLFFDSIGISVNMYGDLSDMVVYSDAKKWMYFIELGKKYPYITPQRCETIEKLLQNTKLWKIYISTFWDRREFVKHHLKLDNKSENLILTDGGVIRCNAEETLKPLEQGYVDKYDDPISIAKEKKEREENRRDRSKKINEDIEIRKHKELKLNPKYFSYDDLKVFRHCFKKFEKDSYFEYILQRWTYEYESMEIDDFFNCFRQVEHVNELLSGSIQLIRDQERFNKADTTWKLYNLTKEMFHWNREGRGIKDLFRSGSARFTGYASPFDPPETYDNKAKKYYDKFFSVTIPNISDDIIYYSTYLSSSDRQPVTSKKNIYISDYGDKSEGTDKYLYAMKSWVSEWFLEDETGFDDIFVIHNKTRKEFILLITTNKLYA